VDGARVPSNQNLIRFAALSAACGVPECTLRIGLCSLFLLQFGCEQSAAVSQTDMRANHDLR